MLNKEPKSWNDISVNQYIELNELDKTAKEQKMIEDEFNIHLLSLITDSPLSDIENLEYEKFIKLLNQFKFIEKPPINNPLSTIKIEDIDLNLIDFNSLELGAFIDLEHFVGLDYIENIKIIMAILYRQKLENKNPILFEDEFEPYGNWIFKRSKLFGEISILQVYGVLISYLKWREKLLETYEGLFSGPIEEDNTDIPNESVISKSERKKEEQKQRSIKKWSWNLLLYKLANGNPLYMNKASSINIIEAMNILAMKTELNLNEI